MTVINSSLTRGSIVSMYKGQPPTTLTTEYTAPANTSNVPAPNATAVITEITLCNNSSAQATVQIVAGGVNLLAAAYSMSAGQTVILGDLKTTLKAGETIQVQQGTASAISITISGMEVQ